MNILGVDIGGTKMLLLAEQQNEIYTKTVPTGKGCTPEQIRDEIGTFIDTLPDPIDAVGIAIPGLVEQERKVVISDVLPRIAGMDTEFLQMRNLPIYMLNDVQAALHQETASDEETDTVVIMIGTGIAAGMRMGGQIMKGCKGWAGELGSMPVPTADGIEKLDALAGGAGIIARAKMDPDTLRARLKEEDASAQEMIRTAGGYMGLAISSVIHLLNPERIILGGGTLQFEGYVESAVDMAEQQTLPELWEVCTIEEAEDAAYMVARGAGHFAAAKIRGEEFSNESCGDII